MTLLRPQNHVKPVPRSLLAIAMLSVSVVALGACAGGGGGGSSAVTPLPPPPPPPPPPPLPSNPFPASIAAPEQFETREYNATVGLPMIGASAAYAIGATGQGQTVAVIDTGTESDHPDLQGAVVQMFDVCADTACSGYDAAGDRVTITRQPGDIDTGGHGTLVTGVIAARRQDDFNSTLDDNTFNGIQGTAYEASVLDIRADSPGSCARAGEDEGCVYNDDALVRALEYAVAQGATIINMSLGGEIDNDPRLENAVRAAAAAGVLVVISAGNDAEPAGTDDEDNPTAAVGERPTEPAYIAGEASSLGRVVAVGAVDPDGNLSDFSNRAGTAAQNFYLLAPGEDVISTGPDDDVAFPGDPTNDADSEGDYYRISGTSFAAPYVAGALALLLDAFPNLQSQPEVALQILLDTATDYVDTSADIITGEAAGVGTDSVSGVGLMNLEEAFRPQGQQNLDFGMEKVSFTEALAPSGGAFGDWATHSGAFNKFVFQDKYQRGFRLNADAIAATLPQDTLGSRLVNFETRADWAAGDSYAVNAGGMSFSWAQARLQDDPTAPYQEDPQSTFQMRYSFGESQVELGRGGSLTHLAPDISLLNEPGVGNAFSTGGAWAKFSHAVTDDLVMDIFSAEQGGRSQSGFMFGRDAHDWSVRVGASFIADEDTALGGTLQDRFGAQDQTEMTAYSLESAWFAGAGWIVSSGLELASVDLPGVDAEGIWTSRWSVGADRALREGRVHFIMAQPRRAEMGYLKLDAPIGVDLHSQLIRGLVQADLTPSGRQIDFETRYTFGLIDTWSGEAAAVVSTSPNHIYGADDQEALWMRLSTPW
ncbi:MAG: S8 family peptidase [Hyphomonas sp.]|uniref:S8 family peptidase n=1 Tax=Hyphomonas sp. TaxID=87 RepID=UPI003296CAE0